MTEHIHMVNLNMFLSKERNLPYYSYSVLRTVTYLDAFVAGHSNVSLKLGGPEEKTKKKALSTAKCIFKIDRHFDASKFVLWSLKILWQLDDTSLRKTEIRSACGAGVAQSV
jgi:hypothetical protein